MKKLAIVLALAAPAPVFACPNMDHDEAPKTADKDKAKPAETAKGDKKDQPKQDPAPAPAKDQKPADTAKTAKPGDKVSVK